MLEIHKVPRKIHFIYFGGRPFSLVNYLAIKSAYEVNKPIEIIMHCDIEPQNDAYWEKSKQYFTIKQMESPKHIFGLDILHPAHQADIARLLILKEEGGIYLDTDVICNKPLLDLMENRVAFEQSLMGEEILDGKKVGLCSAVIITEINSVFIRRWLDGFDPAKSLWKGFRSKSTLEETDDYYSEISIKYSNFLANYYPEEVKVVDRKHFFYPNYSPKELADFFTGTTGDYENSYAFHLWANAAWDKYLKDMTEESLRNSDTNFAKIVKRFLD